MLTLLATIRIKFDDNHLKLFIVFIPNQDNCSLVALIEGRMEEYEYVEFKIISCVMSGIATAEKPMLYPANIDPRYTVNIARHSRSKSESMLPNIFRMMMWKYF